MKTYGIMSDGTYSKIKADKFHWDRGSNIIEFYRTDKLTLLFDFVAMYRVWDYLELLDD